MREKKENPREKSQRQKNPMWLAKNPLCPHRFARMLVKREEHTLSNAQEPCCNTIQTRSVAPTCISSEMLLIRIQTKFVSIKTAAACNTHMGPFVKSLRQVGYRKRKAISRGQGNKILTMPQSDTTKSPNANSKDRKRNRKHQERKNTKKKRKKLPQKSKLQTPFDKNQDRIWLRSPYSVRIHVRYNRTQYLSPFGLVPIHLPIWDFFHQQQECVDRVR